MRFWPVIWTALIVVAAAWGWKTYFGECGPFRAKEVRYHPGMTLCPGQSARATIVIPLHVPERHQDNGI